MSGLSETAFHSPAVGSVEVPSLVAINGCQASLQGGFHPNRSLETAEDLPASQQAAALPMLTAPETEGVMRDCAGGHCSAGFTPTHMPQQISQRRLHLTLDMQPTKQTSRMG